MKREKKKLEDYISKDLLEKLNHTGNQALSGNDISFSKVYQLFMTGEYQKLFEKLFEMVCDVATIEIRNGKAIGISIFCVGMLSCVFMIMSDSLKSKEIPFFLQKIMGLCVILTGVNVFSDIVDALKSYLELLGEFLRVLFPVFSLTISMASGHLSGLHYYILSLFALNVLQYFLQVVLFPATQLYVVFLVLNNISEENYFGEINKLFKKGIESCTKLGVYLGVGSFFVQGMIDPKLNQGQKSMLMKLVGMIPGVGQLSEGAIEILSASSKLIMSVVGISGGVILILIVVRPMIRIGIYGVLFRGLEIVLAGIGEKKISKISGEFGVIFLFLLRILLCMLALFLLAIVIVILGVS